MNPVASTRKPERGVVIIWSAFFLLFMLGFVALGIDMAKLMTTRTQLQNAADAAALAGASAVNFQTGAIVQDTAVVRAQVTGGENRAFIDSPKPVVVAAGDVSFPTPQRCRVTVRREGSSSMATHVAQVLGIKSLDVTATATAEALAASEECQKLVPMGAIPPDGQQGFQTGCTNTYVLFEGQGGGVNGNWQALSFPECGQGHCAGASPTGASTLGCLVEHGYGCCMKVGQVVQTKPGENAGPMRAALEDRFDRDTDRRLNICYSQYNGNRARIVNVPIIAPLGNGRSDTSVLGFAAFFLKVRPTGGPDQPVVAEFLYDIVPGESNGSPTPGTAYTLRLVE